MAKVAAKKPPTKTEIFTNISEATGLTKKDVAGVFDALAAEIKTAISRNGPGAFTIPGLCKVVVQHKPATKKRQVRSPATGEMVWAKPRPARKVVKVRPLKGLKDMV